MTSRQIFQGHQSSTIREGSTTKPQDERSALRTLEGIINEIGRFSNPKAVGRMARFGINSSKAFGVSVPQLQHISGLVGKSHGRAQTLGKTEIHAGRLRADMTDDP